MTQLGRRARASASAIAMLAACSTNAARPRADSSETPPTSTRNVVLGGDCSFARGVAARASEHGWATLFGDSVGPLASADLAIVNLESPLAPCLPGGDTSRPRLCGDVGAVEALVGAGIDAVSLANNHALDAGEAGLAATVEALRERGIAALGVEAVRTGVPIAEAVGGLSVVAANVTPPAHQPGAAVPIPTPAVVAAAVRAARRAHPERAVLVLLHMGREMDPGPQPRDAAYARPAIAAGAAAVVMHGAHVVRTLGEEAGVPVHLGLGNLLFDQRDPRARRGALLHLRVQQGRPATVAAVTCVDSLTASAVGCETPLSP